MFQFTITPTEDGQWLLEVKDMQTGQLFLPNVFEDWDTLNDEIAIYLSNADGASDLN